MSQKGESIRGKIEKATKALAISEQSLKIATAANQELTSKYAVVEKLVAEQKRAHNRDLKEIGKGKATITARNKDIVALNITVSNREASIKMLNEKLINAESAYNACNKRGLELEAALSKAWADVAVGKAITTKYESAVTMLASRSWIGRSFALFSAQDTTEYFK